MDLSKLPKMSKTGPPPTPDPAGPDPGPQSAHPLDYGREPQASLGVGPEAWISIAVGVIVLLMQQRLVSFIIHKLFDTAFPYTFSDRGQPIAYTQSIFFFHDLGLGLFAVALILEGIVLLIRRSALMWAALGLMVVATVWNLITVVRFYPDYGLQILPALAVAFGVYIAIHQWRVLQIGRLRSEI